MAVCSSAAEGWAHVRERACWLIENYGYRRCQHPGRDFPFAISLHNHSAYSVEDLASLNQVVKLWFMRPLRGTLQRAFGLQHIAGLNYADLKYNPPFSPEEVHRIEAAAVAPYGFDGVHLAITDHDEYAGSLELCQRRPDLNGRVVVGEELTVPFDGHVFHLGISGLEASSAAPTVPEVMMDSNERFSPILIPLTIRVGLSLSA